MNNQLPELCLDFGRVGYGNRAQQFSVRLCPIPLQQLLADADRLLRTYELCLLTRPGDIWDYINVQIVNAPEIVFQRLKRLKHPEKPQSLIHIEEYKETVPFPTFDGLFEWAEEDTEPVDEAWLNRRGKEELTKYVEEQLSVVKQKISALSSSDPLSRHIFNLIKTQQHPFDFLSRSEALKQGKQHHPAEEQHTTEFYNKLSEILKEERVFSVAYRGNGDLHVLRLLATEQRLRAESNSRQKPSEALKLSALVENRIVNKAWDSEIVFYSEGLAYGDLFIQGPGMDSNGIKKLIDAKQRQPPGGHILSWKDEGEIDGFTKNSGLGWFLYSQYQHQTATP